MHSIWPLAYLFVKCRLSSEGHVLIRYFYQHYLHSFLLFLNIEISQGTVRKLKPLQPQNKKSKISPASQEHQPGTLLKSPLTNLLV